GINPVCPGDTRQEITSPVFSKITVRTPAANGNVKNFTITALHNSDRNIYIQSARLNGKTYNKCYLDYKEIAAGGQLELVMGPQPNKSWGIPGKDTKN
ncbi:MAG: glycoside hydrolase domain-containing protein, partial [Mucilaginibacter sp.]